jgi:hypothetical protein
MAFRWFETERICPKIPLGVAHLLLPPAWLIHTPHLVMLYQQFKVSLRHGGTAHIAFSHVPCCRKDAIYTDDCVKTRVAGMLKFNEIIPDALVIDGQFVLPAAQK